MILPIYTYGQPVLRKVAQDIEADFPGLEQLIEDMYETMDKSDGVGLAAPQIGKAIRVIVISLDVLKEDFPEYAGFRHAYINPHINLRRRLLKFARHPRTGKTSDKDSRAIPR